jgi:ribose transport system permease protein
MVVFAVLPMLALGYLYSRTRLGRELLLTGSNPRAAELSGISVRRRVIAAHLLSGLLAGLAGFLLAVTTGSFRASIGEEFLLPSFLGAVLGGTALAGGVISVTGTFLGASLTLVIRKGLELLGIGLEYLNVYLGVILLLALSAERVRTLLFNRRGE